MAVVLIVLVWALTVLWRPSEWLARQLVELWWERKLPKSEAQMTEHLKAKAGPPEVPKAIMDYANSWYDAWAKEEALERAKRLFAEHHNWDIVYQKLLEQDGEAAKKVTA